MTNDFVMRDRAVRHEDAKILLVEDEIIVRWALSAELREHGHTVIEAASADEALSVLRSGTSVDVVVTDLHMPGALNGCDLVKLIRLEFAWLKVIVVSAQAPDADLRSLLDGYVSKPVLPSDFVRHLRTLTSVRADPQMP